MRAMSKKTKGADGHHEAPVDLTAPLQVKMKLEIVFKLDWQRNNFRKPHLYKFY